MGLLVERECSKENNPTIGEAREVAPIMGHPVLSGDIRT
jgi:hypothetical protein